MPNTMIQISVYGRRKHYMLALKCLFYNPATPTNFLPIHSNILSCFAFINFIMRVVVLFFFSLSLPELSQCWILWRRTPSSVGQRNIRSPRSSRGPRGPHKQSELQQIPFWRKEIRGIKVINMAVTTFLFCLQHNSSCLFFVTGNAFFHCSCQILLLIPSILSKT